MRRIFRKELVKRVQDYLSRKQREVAPQHDINKAWKSARQTLTMKRVFEALLEMSGERNRCMFCDDSRGTTIEHFWPKSTYRCKCFLWENMLLLCQGCQSQKGDRFALDQDGKPLLLNPTEEDPWDFLYFEPTTGILTARFDKEHNQPNPKGAHTTDRRILPLNIESVTEGRLRTRRNLQRAVMAFLRDPAAGSSPAEAESTLVQAIRDNDDYGLVVWYFLRDGNSESPFADLKRNRPATWHQICGSLRQNERENVTGPVASGFLE